MLCANSTANAHSKIVDMIRFLATKVAKVAFVLYQCSSCRRFELQKETKYVLVTVIEAPSIRIALPLSRNDMPMP